MTEQHQTEQADEQAQPGCTVVILTDGTVLKWPTATTSFRWDDDGDLTLYRHDPDTGQRVEATAGALRGKWAAVYEEGHLAD
ncbi:hypothetical protein [Pseudonocardia sp. N23]|uniref:hypothetical protein n=1 Tax=Pseudonocardia sp. N23 TaxID=1987376 RepID=UPI000BFEA1EA|nr:hypothetical protein [Pseudonocardia sp. N23]GAY12047.1 hypothetical protein TOK_0437 [Pseudonocardia sp. N23]